ncbi:MAG: phosphate signaling complex protein PhoU [Dehalococcoidia bacterium]|nr:phosphate signaling complex protein PhoU [Dehalococcoidia bacterium]
MFSLGWARVMYFIWPQPSFLTFLWFYLAIGGIVLKWVIFEVLDRVNLKLRLRGVKRELDESRKRVWEASSNSYQLSCPLEKNMEGSPDTGDELKKLQGQVLNMAAMVARAIGSSIESLKTRDLKIARALIEGDRKIDQAQSAIRDSCIQIIAKSCPQAGDLHMIAAVLGIITEFERMGDYAEGIAKLVLMIGERPHMALPGGVVLMAQKGIEMLNGSMKSFMGNDVTGAVRISEMDGEVDTLHDQVFRELILIMVKSPAMVTQATWLLWVAHHLERFGDRVTNVCEWIVFSTMGDVDSTGGK